MDVEVKAIEGMYHISGLGPSGIPCVYCKFYNAYKQTMNGSCEKIKNGSLFYGIVPSCKYFERRKNEE